MCYCNMLSITWYLDSQWAEGVCTVEPEKLNKTKQDIIKNQSHTQHATCSILYHTVLIHNKVILLTDRQTDRQTNKVKT